MLRVVTGVLHLCRLLQINGQDVTVADHKEVVKVVRSAGGKPLVMKVMFPSQPPANGGGGLPRDSLQSISERGRHFSESSASNHSPAPGHVGRVPAGGEQGERVRSRYDTSLLHERRLRQGSDTSAPPSLQSTPTRQRVMSDVTAARREDPLAPVINHYGPVPPPRGDSPLPCQNGSVSSLQSSQSSHSSSSQQGHPPDSSSTPTPQPTESEEDVEEDHSELAKQLQTAIKKREDKQRSQSVGGFSGEAGLNTYTMAGRERKMSAFESEVHQKAEERLSRVMEDKLRVTTSKQAASEVPAGQSSMSVHGSLANQTSTQVIPPRDSVDILTKLMAVVGQVPDKERDSLEGGFRQSWASDDSSSRPVSTVTSPNTSHTQLLPVIEIQQADLEEGSKQAASEDDSKGDLDTHHSAKADREHDAPVASPPTAHAAPSTAAAPPPASTSAPPSTATVPQQNTTSPSHNPATPQSTTVAPSPNTHALQTTAPPPTLPKPKWLKDGRTKKPTFASTSNLYTNPADDTRVRAASTSNLLPAGPKEPSVPPASAPPLGGGQADIVPDQHGWFDVKSFLKSSATKRPTQDGVSTTRPTLTAAEEEEEEEEGALSASQYRRMHSASSQPLVVAEAFDEEDSNVGERTEDREAAAVEEQPAALAFDFDDVSSSGFDWSAWESSVTVSKDLQVLKGSTGDVQGGRNTATGGWPSFYDDNPVMEAWGEDETMHSDNRYTEGREEDASPLEEEHHERSNDESPLGGSLSILDLPPPITNNDSLEGEEEVGSLENLLEPVPPELLPPPLLDDEAEEAERVFEDSFILPPPLEIEGATVDESSTDLPLSILPPPSDVPTPIMEDFHSTKESSLPFIGGDLPPPNFPSDMNDELPPAADYSLPPPPHLEDVLDETSDIPSLPPPLADHLSEGKAGGRLSVVIDAPFDFQPFAPEKDLTLSTQQSDNESDTSDLPPPPPSSAPPTDFPSDTPLDFMLPPPLNSEDNRFITPVEINVMAPPPRFEADAADDDVFASSGSLVEVKDQEKLSSTPPSLRAPFSRYSLALEADTLGLHSQV